MDTSLLHLSVTRIVSQYLISHPASLRAAFTIPSST